ncbi:MAG: hypothetical protein AB7I32_21455, partial [Gammaproteobacteria bacterium]
MASTRLALGAGLRVFARGRYDDVRYANVATVGAAAHFRGGARRKPVVPPRAAADLRLIVCDAFTRFKPGIQAWNRRRMTAKTPSDPIATSLFAARLQAVCDEMGASLRRAALSPNIKDR